jgi:hypothetical protein
LRFHKKLAEKGDLENPKVINYNIKVGGGMLKKMLPHQL